MDGEGILLEADMKQPENGYEGNPIKAMNGENPITFQFKLNQTISLHNGQSMGSAVPNMEWT